MRKIILIFVIAQFIYACNNKKEKQEGEKLADIWVVENSEILPFELPDSCKDINKNDVFSFSNDSILVIKKGTGTECAKYNYNLEGDVISIISYDMIFEFKIESLGNEKLILSLRHLPKNLLMDWKNEYDEYLKNGFKITLKKKSN